jgi:hypothetical protein
MIISGVKRAFYETQSDGPSGPVMRQAGHKPSRKYGA